MPKYKNIRIKKKGGGTRLQRVQVLASGKYKFVKNKKGGAKRSKSAPKKGKKRSTTRKSNPKGGNRTGRRGLSFGNKKSVIVFIAAGLIAKVPQRIVGTLQDPDPLGRAQREAQDLWDNNKMPLAAMGGAYWMWGKPWRGKL